MGQGHSGSVESLPPNHLQGFLVGATEEHAPNISRLNWKQDHPVWADQWPLPEEKLSGLESLVAEQLSKGHIVPSNSPWNTPVFVIKKPGKDKWRVFQDLCKINDVIEEFTSLQSGMPSPIMLPRECKLAIIDIKDSFFNIPLHLHDAPLIWFSQFPPKTAKRLCNATIGLSCLRAWRTVPLFANGTLPRFCHPSGNSFQMQ